MFHKRRPTQLLGFAVVLSAGALLTHTALYAEPIPKDSEIILRQTDGDALQALSEQFRQQHLADEAAVEAYLQANPSVPRTEIIDGNVRTIVRIDNDGNPVYRVSKGGGNSSVAPKSNVESASLIKANSLYKGGSLGVEINGTGMVAGVWEPGLPRVDHELLDGKTSIVAGQGTPTDATDDENVDNRNHATHVTGTMVGKDFTTDTSRSSEANAARGVAFGATAKNWTADDDLSEMAAAASSSSPLLISNHSYGDANTQTTDLARYGAYDAEAKAWDQLTKAAPFYLPFIAGGNEQQSSGNGKKSGYDIMTGSSASKNAMTVGAVNANKSMSDYSNWGPTDDGRVKPEIVARGTGINSAQAFDKTPAPSTTAYSGSGVDSSGSSFAAPAASAGALLLQQYYKSLNSNRAMRASTLKTLIMGTAEDLGQTGPDYKFGYGLMNVEAAATAMKKNSTTVSGTNCAPPNTTGSVCEVTSANSRGAMLYEWNANPISDSNAEITMKVIAKGGEPLVVNLGWTDDDGVEQTTGANATVDPTDSRMVYDFDLTVSDPAKTVFRPWVLPGMANRTDKANRATDFFQANGGPFRQVIVTSPVADAIYTIVVRKKVGSPAPNRTLSLVITGMKETSGAPKGVTITEGTINTDRKSGTVTDGTGRLVTFAVSQGELSNLSRVSGAGIGFAPDGVVFNNGIFDYRITGLNAGTSANVTISLPAGSAVNDVYKCIGGVCSRFNGAQALAGNVVTITVTDGGIGDADTIAGQISDPVAPAFVDVADENLAGGCTVSTNGNTGLQWLLLAMMGGLMMRRRQKI